MDITVKKNAARIVETPVNVTERLVSVKMVVRQAG